MSSSYPLSSRQIQTLCGTVAAGEGETAVLSSCRNVSEIQVWIRCTRRLEFWKASEQRYLCILALEDPLEKLASVPESVAERKEDPRNSKRLR